MAIRKHTTIRNIALVASSTFLGLLFAEIILRAFFPISYSMEVEYIPDGHLGHRFKPNKIYTLQSKGTCTINNLGFRRTTDVIPEKAPHTIRIVALGGSSTFSYHVDDQKTWTSLLEQKLKARYGHDFEVINAGVPGYSIFESKINYVYQIRPLRPDIVIVYHTWNDMKFFHLLERGTYPLKEVYRPNKINSFLRHFQLAWRLRNYLNEVIYPWQRENAYGSPPNYTVSITPNGRAHQWEKQNYDDLALLLKQDNVLPIFTSQAGLLSTENLDDPAIRALVYTEHQRLSFEETLTQWNAISKIIEHSARENDALFIDLYNAVPHQVDYLRDHVHLTEHGNALVAETLFNGLTQAARVDSLVHMIGSDN